MLLAETSQYALTWAGITLMTLSLTSVTLLTLYCVYKVIRLPPVEAGDLHAPIDP